MSKTSDVLHLAADLVEKGWTTGANAREGNAAECSPHASTATCWCANGALIAAGALKNTDAYAAVYAQLPAAIKENTSHISGIVYFNDFHARHVGDVSQLLRKAAENV
jgi:hypothetical protein